MTYTPSSSLSEDYAPWLSRQIATLERERQKHERRLGYGERRICIPPTSRGRGSLCGSQENVAETAGSICHDLKLSADDPDSNQRIIKACERIKSGDLPDFHDISCFKKTAEQAARECIFFFKTMRLFRRIYFFSFPNKLRYFPLSLSRNVAPCRLSPYHPFPSSLTAPDSCLSVPVQRSGGGE